ncbi:hypothetical protein ACYSNR_11310 [Enterococcus sp. LJL128]
MEYRKLAKTIIEPELFSHFIRHQKVTQCWRKVDKNWQIQPVAFVEEW